MKSRLISRLLPCALLCAVVILISSCGEDKPEFTDNVWVIETTQDYNTTAQEALINMNDNDTIHFRAGTYMMNSQLSVSGKSGIVIRGEGRENTVLDFSEQLSGAQGILATDLTNIIFADITIQDPEGDCIKVKDADGCSFIRVGAIYTGGADPDNGAYGLYPVTSSHVLVEDCYVKGASDAGIYVGQSEQVHVTGNYVEECVAGIEIENCRNSDVWENTATHNTGGILVFDLPTLPVIKNGNTCRVFDNDLIDNTTGNFAPPGNAVGNVPEGTGIMILAFDGVEVFNNNIDGNNILGVGIVSHRTLEALDPGAAHTDDEYDPYTYDIHVHDNTFTRNPSNPTSVGIGFILGGVYQAEGIAPDIVYDGDINPDLTLEEQGICIHDNGGAQFVNLDAINLFENVVVEPTGHDCEPAPLPVTEINAPILHYGQ